MGKVKTKLQQVFHPAPRHFINTGQRWPGASTDGCLFSLGFKVFSHMLCHVIFTTIW